MRDVPAVGRRRHEEEAAARLAVGGGGSSDSCVEVATTPATIHIRDSKTPETGQLKVTPSAWAVFLTHAAK
ncbi:DUF397 domain-containing protein [Streptomyces sp. NPDC001410]|uniref:DUF397 domain-containing protein n=1 Tax=Streptomyces sp. NPDC001410 TaxID=3364574 RepID=UPI00367F81AF